MEEMEKIREMLDFIKKSPTQYHAVANFRELCLKNSFIELDERKRFSIERGKSYFVSRGSGSIIAFRVPDCDFECFSIIEAHTDSPTFRLKRNAEVNSTPYYTTLNVESYGGAIISTWFDRPLSVAGRIFVDNGEELREVLVDAETDLVLIPNLAIHLNREINSGYHYHVQKDVQPLFSVGKGSILDFFAKKYDLNCEEISDYDLFLYNRSQYSVWGADGEFISSPRLDDMECAYLAMKGLFDAESGSSFPLVALFDNEEVGSSSQRGALSDFLSNILSRISISLSIDREKELMTYASSLVLSADNGHAVHPNYPEKSDISNKTVLNGGVVIKYSANQKYTSDASTSSVIRSLMRRNGIKSQDYFNHSDIVGGSTLGNLSIQKVSIPTVDVGLAELAMHSSYESAGRYDVKELYALFKAFLSR